MNIDYFGNDKYRVLTCMAKRQISVKDSTVIKLSDAEDSTSGSKHQQTCRKQKRGKPARI